MSAVREPSLAKSVEMDVVALHKKHTKTCNCGCSRYDLPFRRLTFLQTSLTKSNVSVFQSHCHTFVRSCSCNGCGKIRRQRAGVRALWVLRTELYHKQKFSENVDRSRTGRDVIVRTYKLFPLKFIVLNFSSPSIDMI